MQFPLCKEKFNSKEITSAIFFAKTYGQDKVFEKLNQIGAIFIWHPNHFKEFVEPFNPKEVKAEMYAKVHVINYKQKNILIISGFGTGGPAITHTAEELYARGVKNFINYGGCGGISEKLKHSEIVIVNMALRDEGTSYHYLPPARYVEASEKLTNALKKASKDTKVKIGATWTNDSMFREAEIELIQYRKEGILIVENENASLYAFAKARKLDASSIVVVNDVLQIGEWKLKKKNTSLRKKNLKKAFEIALDALILASLKKHID